MSGEDDLLDKDVGFRDFNVWKVGPTNVQLNISDLLQRYHLVLNHYPITVPWQNCNPVGKDILYEFTISSSSHLNQPKISKIDAYVFSVDETDLDNVFQGKLLVNPCYNTVIQNVFEQFLMESGLYPGFIYNVATS
jgi:hypothetical protein